MLLYAWRMIFYAQSNSDLWIWGWQNERRKFKKISSEKNSTMRGRFTPNASARFHQFGASVRKILFNVMLRKTRTCSPSQRERPICSNPFVRRVGCVRQRFKYNIWTLHFHAFIWFYWWIRVAKLAGVFYSLIWSYLAVKYQFVNMKF